MGLEVPLASQYLPGRYVYAYSTEVVDWIIIPEDPADDWQKDVVKP